MEFVYTNDSWPFRVQTYEPDNTPITVDDATVTITKLEDMSVVLPKSEIAKLFGLKRTSQIAAIVKGKAWKHIVD